jgi:hypothetical protein
MKTIIAIILLSVSCWGQGIPRPGRNWLCVQGTPTNCNHWTPWSSDPYPENGTNKHLETSRCFKGQVHICEDGFMVHFDGKHTQKQLCGEHGGGDTELKFDRIRAGYDWLVEVHPAHPRPTPMPTPLVLAIGGPSFTFTSSAQSGVSIPVKYGDTDHPEFTFPSGFECAKNPDATWTCKKINKK